MSLKFEWLTVNSQRTTEAQSTGRVFFNSVDRLSSTLRSHHRHYGQFSPDRASERFKFEQAVLVYRALHGTAPRYLSEELCYVADMPVGERSSPVVDLQWVQSAGCPTVTPRYCCWPVICHSCVSQDLERSSWWCHVCHIFRPTNISSRTESTFISSVLLDIILWLSFRPLWIVYQNVM